ncbi:hypothetical protein AVEN_206847-1 [Araneus ventricosus]|uniref:Uncharacterized protein n=1 Tax=Araneus ventricosus TaxID=182803 RepID=A0A4Y2FC63_ARAVE|nr:hypothetical protein AVEN_206847-1 [Araneus ventricosus]
MAHPCSYRDPSPCASTSKTARCLQEQENFKKEERKVPLRSLVFLLDPDPELLFLCSIIKVICHTSETRTKKKLLLSTSRNVKEICGEKWFNKRNWSMEEELNSIPKQPDPFDFIAVRHTLEEDILDLQPVMPTARDSSEENIIDAVAKYRLWKEKNIPYGEFLNKPQENYEAFQNKASFSGMENQMNKNFQLRNVEVESSPDMVPNHLTQSENFPSDSRRINRFAKGIDLNDFPLSLIKKLNGNKQSSMYKRSEEVEAQNRAFDGFSNQKKVLEKQRRNHPFNLPRQRFSEAIMHRRKGSNHPRKSYRVEFKDQKNRYHRPKLYQNQKLIQTVPSSKLLTRIPLDENQETNSSLKASNIKFPDNKSLNQFANFVEKLDYSNVSAKMSSKSEQTDSSTMIKEQNSGTVSSGIKEMKTPEKQMDERMLKSESTPRNQLFETFLENKTDSSNKKNNLPAKQAEVSQTNLLELQKSERTNLLTISQENRMNLDYLTTASLFNSSQINATTDDVIHIELFDDFATYSAVGREKKAVMNKRKKKIFENWKKADLILTGLAGFAGLALVTVCICYGQFKKKRQTRCEEIESSNDPKNVEGNFEKSPRKSERILKNIFRSVSKDSKRKNKREQYDSHVQNLDAMHTGNSNETSIETGRTERTFSPNKEPMKYIPKVTSQENYTLHELQHSELESENFVCYQESATENSSEVLVQKSASDGNIYRKVSKINQDGKVKFAFDKSDDSQVMKTEEFPKPILRHSSSESSVQNVYRDNSETESNQTTTQSSSDTGKLNNLPSLPSVSSCESGCRITERNTNKI